MPKLIKPSDISNQVAWDIGEALEFCSNVLEDVNDHNISLALAAINAGAYDLAKEFIDLEKDQDEAGELTKDLRERRQDLMEKLEEAEGQVDESEEEDDPRSRQIRR